jgi:hypothetical protein
MTMAARGVDPPNVPAQRPSAPQAAAAVSGVKPNTAPAGHVGNVVTRPPAKRPGANEPVTTKDANRAAGGPQTAGAHTARVVRAPKRDGADGSGSRDPGAGEGLRNILFEFTAPAGGLPLLRSAETVAILRDLLALLPTLPDDIGELAPPALRHEIACHSALLARSHQSIMR